MEGQNEERRYDFCLAEYLQKKHLYGTCWFTVLASRNIWGAQTLSVIIWDPHKGGGKIFFTSLPECKNVLHRWIVNVDIKKKVLWFYGLFIQRGMFKFTCEFCVKNLFVLLPDLLLVVFKQPLTQVAHLLQCKRGLVLPWGTWDTQKSDQRWKGRITHIRGTAISHRDRSVLTLQKWVLGQVQIYSFASCRPSPLPADKVMQH